MRPEARRIDDRDRPAMTAHRMAGSRERRDDVAQRIRTRRKRTRASSCCGPPSSQSCSPSGDARTARRDPLGTKVPVKGLRSYPTSAVVTRSRVPLGKFVEYDRGKVDIPLSCSNFQ